MDLADELSVREAEEDAVICPGVDGENLAERALRALREALPERLPPLEVRIEKRIPVAAGLGGGSADAAAVLRAGNLVAGEPLDAARLRTLGAALGADVPAQIEARHALVTGIGDEVEGLDLAPMAFVLVPQREGLRTPAVYAELDRLGLHRERLDADRLRQLATRGVDELAAAVENDLEPAALSLKPELAEPLDDLRAAGPLAAALSGSGPTAFGLFGSVEEAERAAAGIPEALVARGRGAG